MTSNLRLPASGALLLLATHLGLIFVPAHSVRLACATLFVFLLPGFGWVSGIWVRRGAASRLELLLLNSGLSLTLSTLTGLVFHLCGAPFTEVSFFGVLDAISLAGLLFCGLRARLSENRPWLSLPSTRTVLSLLLLLFVTCSLRLANLGYAEFQGDEIRVLAPAQSVVLGDRGVLFAQKKGPVQTLLAASFALTTHGFHEGDMRFPFAVASSLAVLALYLIGREVFGPRIGLIAGLILSIEGLALAFSRVVQYQAIVLLMVTLSILCFYRISDGQKSRDPRPYLALGILFFAMGLLAHYDTVFALPALVYLYYRRYGLALPRKQIGVTVLALVAAGTLLAVFYVPFLLQPQFQDTFSGYTQGKLQPGLYNNLDRYVEISGFYNSVYYVGFLCLMLVLGSWEFGYRALRSHRLAHLPGLSLGIGLIVCILWPTVLRTSRVELGLLFVVPLLITPCSARLGWGIGRPCGCGSSCLSRYICSCSKRRDCTTTPCHLPGL